MRFLHLADLHFGKSLYGVSLIDNKDQEVWKERFLEKAQKLQVDAVVIAGDVYDRSAPSGEAVVLLGDMLTRLEAMGIPVMIIAGNHDSGLRLSFAGDILAKRKIYIAGVLEKELCHVTIKERDKTGEVTFWLLPYLFPAAAAQRLEDDSITDYETAVRKLLERQSLDFSARNVLVAHQNVTAFGQEAKRGGSESMVGGVGQVDYRVFDGFDYVALGHIHSSYAVGRSQVRYAGSPLCYHFDETRQPLKGPLLVEIGPKGEDGSGQAQIKVETVLIEPLHPMREIKGTCEEIRREARDDERKGEYLRIVVTDQRVTPELLEFVRERFRRRGSVVMELLSDFREFGAPAGETTEAGREEKSIEEYFAELYRERKNQAEPGEEDLKLFSFAAERARNQENGENREASLEKDADQLLDYILGQEV